MADSAAPDEAKRAKYRLPDRVFGEDWRWRLGVMRKWLTLGLGVKRWFVALAVGLGALGLGLGGLELTFGLEAILPRGVLAVAAVARVRF
jgi:hypothetical protein